MRLVEFLIQLLQTQAEVLQHLTELFGPEVLFEMLETAGENYEEESRKSGAKAPNLVWFTRPNSSGAISPSTAYTELEGSVREYHLPEMIEFHLWAYPHYRAFIESPLDLNSSIVRNEYGAAEPAVALVEEALEQARTWIRNLPIPPEHSKAAELAARTTWLRFRTRVYRRIGIRPVDPI